MKPEENKKEETEEAPKKFSLSKEERLEIQNITLKKQLLETQFQGLMQEQGAWAARIQKRLSIDIGDYEVDTDAGIVSKKK